MFLLIGFFLGFSLSNQFFFQGVSSFLLFFLEVVVVIAPIKNELSITQFNDFVGKLSGGEKARLALALMLLSPCNLLVLDEPTNHLDIPAKQMLEDALMAYEGAALLVSHDRYFISRVANKIVELRDGELVLYRGDYNYYLEKKQEERANALEKELVAQREAKKKANQEKQKARTARKKKSA